MRRYSRALGGLKAQRAGSTFEAHVELQANVEGLSFVKIPPGCKNIGGNKIIRIASPFDCILGHGDQLIVLDLKSTTAQKLSMADNVVKKHQKEALSALGLHQRAGLLVQFNAHDRVIFFHASKLYGKPLGPEDGQVIGTLNDIRLKTLFYPI